MRCFYLLCCLVACVAGSVRAQALLRQADRQFDNLSYSTAIDLYEQTLNRSELSEEVRLATLSKLGYSYRQVRDTQNAERVYRILIGQLKQYQNEYVPCYLYYAQALASNGKYQESQEMYDRYSKLQQDDQRGKQFSKLYHDVSILSRNPGNYKIEFLEINTTQAEFSPMYYKEGLVFVTSKRPGNALKRVFSWDHSAFLDLYYMPEAAFKGETVASLGGASASQRKKRAKNPRMLGEDDYTDPTANDSRTVGFSTGAAGPYATENSSETKRFGGTLNTKYHEGPVAFTKDGSKVFFTRNNYNKGKYRESADGINKLKLYVAEEQKGSWGEAQELPFNNDDYSTGHPALSPNDKMLFFASDRPGGFGGNGFVRLQPKGRKMVGAAQFRQRHQHQRKRNVPVCRRPGQLVLLVRRSSRFGRSRYFLCPVDRPNGGEIGAEHRRTTQFFERRTSVSSRMVPECWGISAATGCGAGATMIFIALSGKAPCMLVVKLTIHVFDNQTKQPLGNTRLDLDQKDVPDGKRQTQTDSEGNIRICLDPESDFRITTAMTGYQSSLLGFSTKGLSDDQPLATGNTAGHGSNTV